MRSLIVLSLAFAAVFAVPIAEPEPFVVGGENALPGQFPFIVSLQWIVLGVNLGHICGGSILSNNWILTGAHCITDISILGRIVIHAGRHNMAATEPDQSIHEIARTVLHDDWVPGPQVGPDDLALLELATPLVFSARIRAVRLPAAHAIPVGEGTLSGWGSDGTGGATLPSILQFTTKPFITIPVCRDAFNSFGLDGSLVDHTNVCTGPLTGGVSACSGDSGGPLVQGVAPNEIQVGVVSWGVTPCGTVGSPTGVYKRVSAYIDWIQLHTGVGPS